MSKISAYTGYVRIEGKVFDIKEYLTVENLLRCDKGRKAILKWLSKHEESPYYDMINSIVSDIRSRIGDN